MTQGKGTCVDRPKVCANAPKTCADALQECVDTAKVRFGAPQARVDAPKVRSDAPQVYADAPKVCSGAPQVRAGSPKVCFGAPQMRANTPRVHVEARQPTVIASRELERLRIHPGGIETVAKQAGEGPLEEDDEGGEGLHLLRGQGWCESPVCTCSIPLLPSGLPFAKISRF